MLPISFPFFIFLLPFLSGLTVAMTKHSYLTLNRREEFCQKNPWMDSSTHMLEMGLGSRGQGEGAGLAMSGVTPGFSDRDRGLRCPGAILPPITYQSPCSLGLEESNLFYEAHLSVICSRKPSPSTLSW